MNTRKLKFGLMLIDMLVAVVIVAVLAAIVLTTLTSIDRKNQETLCRATMETLNTALRQFRDYGYEYRIDTTNDDEREFYRSLKFPPDCNGYDIADVYSELKKLLDIAHVTISPPDAHSPESLGIGVMCFFLNRLPEVRETLAGIDDSMLETGDIDIRYVSIGSGDIRRFQWAWVLDPWATPLRYDYYDEVEVLAGTSNNFKHALQTIRSFPLITSAGPDKEFGTDDDITNRDKTQGATYQN